ncbi:helix-turn-helix domain-containing protein [Streptomyces sp. NPDC002586]|uniref:MarR family transcriptional regulator n=1 Tax=Streptomyces sp. NPDC002589 TaxID=3154420 RepID=UPI0033188487
MTTTDSTRTLHPVPDPEPLAGLSGAPAAIYAELVNLTGDDMATVAELALAAGLGRSTTGKALVTLEEHGLAVRTPGGHDGPRRTPDRWRAAPTGASAVGDTETGLEPVNAESVESAAIDLEPADDTDNENAPADEAPPVTSATPAPDGDAKDANPSPADAAPEASAPDAGQEKDSGSGDARAEDGNSGSTAPATPVSQAVPGQPKAAQVEDSTLPGGKKRLAPGALRQMVIDHLSAHPGEAFTATGISRVIEKSSGAIANALVKLVRENIAEQVSERPRAYRLVTPQANA